MATSNKYLETNKIVGTWQSKRLILDRRHGIKTSYFGKMTITPEDRLSMKRGQGGNNAFISLLLSEDGNLTYNNRAYQFSQKYRLHLFEERCEIFFNNKFMFFSIDRLSETQEIRHVCKLDQYIGQIVFVNESAFLLSFTVAGPKKAYYLKVLYKR